MQSLGYHEQLIYDQHEEFINRTNDIQEKWNIYLISATLNDPPYLTVFHDRIGNLK